MPYAYVYQCSECPFDVEIKICQEFQRESDGGRADYEYPAPDVYEWPPRRVAGLWSYLWCANCRAVRPAVVVELDAPAEHPVQAFLAAEARGLTGTEGGPCPECGRDLEWDLEGVSCPECASGRLTCIGEYEP
jgi:DNA-directed RNA polymerase subunit RPC12/RpoP